MTLRRMFLIVLIGVTLIGGLMAIAHFTGLNTYAEGLRSGQLSKFSLRGNLPPIPEGEILLGKDSTPVIAEGNTTNPWAFSSSRDVFEGARGLIGERVVVSFRELRFALPFTGDTNNRVSLIERTDAPAPLPTDCRMEASGWKSDGDRVGRIVSVVSRGLLFKTDEVTMQVGNAGGQFVDMSILDEAILDCAIEALRQSAEVRVTYAQDYFFNPLARETSYRIIAITAVGAPR